MKEKYTTDTFLARWIANELDPDELKEFQNSEAYQQFNKINEASMLLKVPNYNQSEIFNKITKKTNAKNKSTKTVKLVPKWMYSAAASIIILLSLFYYTQNNSSKFSTKHGELLTIKLPDNSIAHLSPNSSLEFMEKSWKTNRILSLKGEAYFEVEKGRLFTVNTNQGNVIVLGTKFTVNTSNNFFEVQCFEGKVKAISKSNKQAILTEGKAFRSYNNQSENWNFSKKTPSWLNGESDFNNSPLSQVIISLEKQYNLKFDTSKIDTNKRFTGTFTHKDINVALKTVFLPMKILFKSAGNNSIILTDS